MNTNLISVIIPVYNTAEYLPRCLDSVLNNTYRELEVLCINDGSRDNSLEILNSYAAQDSRIRVISQENAGVSAARNRGLDAATGEYIAFVDSDDWIHERYFEILLSVSLRNHADITVCKYAAVQGLVEAPQILPDEVTVKRLTVPQIASEDIPSWARLYRADVIGNSRFSKDISLSEDTVFNLELLHTLADPKVVQFDSELYYYWVTRSDSLVHTLPVKEFAPIVEYYPAHLDTVSTQELRNIYLIQALKTIFLWRYRAMFAVDQNGSGKRKQLLKQGKAALRSACGISLPIKLVYMTMAQFPITYRLFRILHDPTMLGWERLQREKAQAVRNAKQNEQVKKEDL